MTHRGSASFQCVRHLGCHLAQLDRLVHFSTCGQLSPLRWGQLFARELASALAVHIGRRSSIHRVDDPPHHLVRLCRAAARKPTEPSFRRPSSSEHCRSTRAWIALEKREVVVLSLLKDEIVVERAGKVKKPAWRIDEALMRQRLDGCPGYGRSTVPQWRRIAYDCRSRRFGVIVHRFRRLCGAGPYC